MFDAIWKESQAASVEMSCYIDDMTFSGDRVTTLLMKKVKALILNRGLFYHKLKTFRQEDAKLVTGVVVQNGRVLVPDSRKKKIRESILIFKNATDDKAKKKAKSVLLSRICEAIQITEKDGTTDGERELKKYLNLKAIVQQSK